MQAGAGSRQRGGGGTLVPLRGASLARPKRKARRPRALMRWLDNWACLVGLHERMKQWHGVASATCPAHSPAEVGVCPAKVRKLLELQELNPPAASVTAWACCCPEDIRVSHIGAKWEQNLPRRLAARCPQAEVGPVCGDADAGRGNQRHSRCEQKGVLAVAPMKTRSGFLVWC